MRLRGLYIISLALAALAFYSCQKELSYEGGAPITGPVVPPPVPPPAVSSKDTMRATINGTPWVAQTISAPVISVFSTSNIAITGSGAAGPPAVSLNIPTSLAVGGPYDFSANSVSGIYLPTTTTVLLSSTGQITILENNATTQRVRGNFQFQATDPTGTAGSASLTLGYFSVKYIP
jgi:hypothetical protein